MFTDKFNLFEVAIRQHKANALIQRLNTYGRRPPKLVEQPKELEREIIDFKELEQGCELYIENERYPQRAHLIGDKLQTVTQVKRMLPELMSSFSGGIFKKIIALIFLKQNWSVYVNFIHTYMTEVFSDVKYYNQPVREVYRVLEKFEKIRDIFCAIIEYDMAYRYRFQDIAVEVNKEAFEKQPIREIKRLFDLMIKREVEQKRMRDKWQILKQLVVVYFTIYRKQLEVLKQIVRDINLDEIRSTKEDIYWQNTMAYSMYDFRGVSMLKRYQEYLKEKDGTR